MLNELLGATINTEINIAETLPSEYPANLCDLTKAEQNAIAEDKARWAVAIKWFRDKQQARIKLAELTGHAHDDMRRRLNVLRIGL